MCTARTLKLLLKLNEVWKRTLLWFQIYKITAWERLGHFMQYSHVPSSPSTIETIIPRIWVCRSILLSRLIDYSTEIIISWYSVNYSIHLQSTQPAFLSTQQFYFSHSNKRFYTYLSTQRSHLTLRIMKKKKQNQNPPNTSDVHNILTFSSSK